jgi:PhnB protein
MDYNYKPSDYPSLSPYLVVKGAKELMDLLIQLFNGKELRRYGVPDGSIMHAEVLIDDSVLMLAESSDEYPPLTQLLHVYVQDVDQTYEKAIQLGCESVQTPIEIPGDPDKRGAFKDFAGNIWYISTTMRQE